MDRERLSMHTGLTTLKMGGSVKVVLDQKRIIHVASLSKASLKSNYLISIINKIRTKSFAHLGRWSAKSATETNLKDFL